MWRTTHCYEIVTPHLEYEGNLSLCPNISKTQCMLDSQQKKPSISFQVFIFNIRVVNSSFVLILILYIILLCLGKHSLSSFTIVVLIITPINTHWYINNDLNQHPSIFWQNLNRHIIFLILLFLFIPKTACLPTTSIECCWHSHQDSFQDCYQFFVKIVICFVNFGFLLPGEVSLSLWTIWEVSKSSWITLVSFLSDSSPIIVYSCH